MGQSQFGEVHAAVIPTTPSRQLHCKFSPSASCIKQGKVLAKSLNLFWIAAHKYAVIQCTKAIPEHDSDFCKKAGDRPANRKPEWPTQDLRQDPDPDYPNGRMDDLYGFRLL